jgi:hypothetical protein
LEGGLKDCQFYFILFYVGGKKWIQHPNFEISAIQELKQK